ncbi:MAG: T9SS type A sorting domain-containing protein [Chitinophagaceae bacterium]|nr:T9SS type A sorting domain-containing protein [Chitinophagaceae bacterium]
MKCKFYILALFLGLSFSAVAQSRSDQPQKLVKYYPNPATSVINFDFQRNYNKNYSLMIFNFMGKKVYELKNTPPSININLSDFVRGLFVFQIRDQNGAVIESGKFQVTK